MDEPIPFPTNAQASPAPAPKLTEPPPSKKPWQIDPKTLPVDNDAPGTLADRMDFWLESRAWLQNRVTKVLDPKRDPCTYQVFRYYIGRLDDAIKGLKDVLDAAKITLPVRETSPIISSLADITNVFDNDEAKVYACMYIPYDLDGLPPGNPGEPEFEKLLKPKVALNKAWTLLMHHLAETHTAAFSDTYKLGLTEEEYAAAWRAERKKRLVALLADIDAKIQENEVYTKGLADARANVATRIETNDQMTFDSEIDTEKTPESGD